MVENLVNNSLMIDLSSLNIGSVNLAQPVVFQSQYSLRDTGVGLTTGAMMISQSKRIGFIPNSVCQNSGWRQS